MEKNPIWTEKVNKVTALSLFLIFCAWPVCFCLTFIHCGKILRNNFGYTAEQVIYQNFFVSIVEMLGNLSLIYGNFLGSYSSLPILIESC